MWCGGCKVLYYCAQAKRSNYQNFQKVFFVRAHNALQSRVKKLSQSTFCDQTLYSTSVCRLISHITKVALLNNFQTES